MSGRPAACTQVIADRPGFHPGNAAHLGELIAGAANRVRARGWIRPAWVTGEGADFTLSGAVCARAGCLPGTSDGHAIACVNAHGRLAGYLMFYYGYPPDRVASLGEWEYSSGPEWTAAAVVSFADQTARGLFRTDHYPRARCGYWGEGGDLRARRADCRSHSSRCSCVFSA